MLGPTFNFIKWIIINSLENPKAHVVRSHPLQAGRAARGQPRIRADLSRIGVK